MLPAPYLLLVLFAATCLVESMTVSKSSLAKPLISRTARLPIAPPLKGKFQKTVKTMAPAALNSDKEPFNPLELFKGLGDRLGAYKNGVESILKNFDLSDYDDDTQVAGKSSQCPRLSLFHYLRGDVDFESFPVACFKEAKKRGFKPEHLHLRNTHLATPEHIRQLKWELVVSISGDASQKLNTVPWWLLAKLESVELNFDLKGAAPFAKFVLAAMPKSVKRISLLNVAGNDEQALKLVKKFGGQLETFSLSGDLDPVKFSPYFQGNPNLITLNFVTGNEANCGAQFETVSKILSGITSTKLESVSIGCNNYTQTQLQSVLNAIKPSEKTKFHLSTKTDDFKGWMSKMIMVGDVALDKKANVLMVFTDEEASAEIGFKSATQQYKIEVQKKWIEAMLEMADQYGNFMEFRRAFHILYRGYYGEKRGIQKWEYDFFMNLSQKLNIS